jgi:hypothetical protein
MITWDQIRHHFERDGVHFTEREGGIKLLEVELQLSEGTLELQVTYDEENGVVRFIVPSVNLPRRLPRSRHEVRRALLLLNSCFVLGGFSEGPQGRITFGITVLIEGNELTYAAYRRLLNAVVASLDRAIPWLRQVALGALSAEEAVENILDLNRRIEERRRPPEPLGLAPGVAAQSITEDEIEEFGRALMDGRIPPPE